MYKLFYVSNASDDFNFQIDVEKIPSDSRRKNSELGITGILLFHKGIFLHLIEGDKQKVEILFSKIKNDRRHKDVTCLLSVEGHDRIFNEWNSVFYENQKTDIKMVNQILSWTRKINSLDKFNNEFILGLIHQFKQNSLNINSNT
ncbi:MAG: BLUF domain-containing protein [Bacteriovoracaceae bacterium]